jgi:hypothetical protein
VASHKRSNPPFILVAKMLRQVIESDNREREKEANSNNHLRLSFRVENSIHTNRKTFQQNRSGCFATLKLAMLSIRFAR